MPQQPIFPFRRVSVDHMVRGATRVWWDLDRRFHDTGPYTFQLQFGFTALNAAVDWKDVGAPVVNGYTAYDPEWREGGYQRTSHYRVKLTSAQNTYISQAANCHGELPVRDWLIAREIVRKEQLRSRLVAAPGYLIKRYRYGKPCPRCRDELTQEITDDLCPICNGTGFEVGYHPPLPMQFWDLSPETIREDVDTQMRGATRDQPFVTARVIGFPGLSRDDIWVDGASDKRWLVEAIQVAAAMRNVPLIYNVRLGLLPYSNRIYSMEVGGEAADRDPIPPVAVEACGDITIDHNYGGPDALAYVTADGRGISGAHIYIFKQFDVTDAAPELPPRNKAIAVTSTTANGRWALAVNLSAGEYGILYEQPGQYGPDLKSVTVVAPADLPAPAVTATIKPSYRQLPAGQDIDTNDFWNV